MSAQNYGVGDYQTMCISEKIDFLHKVHRGEISLWDDNGNDNEIWDDYHTVEKELLHHPEMLNCEDVLHIMKIFNDDCFEITWQYNLAKMVSLNCLHYGESRIVFYFQHLTEIPLNGRFHGCHFPIQFLLGEECFSDLKEAIQEQTMEIKKIVLHILDDIEIYQAERDELKAILVPPGGTSLLV